MRSTTALSSQEASMRPASLCRSTSRTMCWGCCSDPYLHFGRGRLHGRRGAAASLPASSSGVGANHLGPVRGKTRRLPAPEPPGYKLAALRATRRTTTVRLAYLLPAAWPAHCPLAQSERACATPDRSQRGLPTRSGRDRSRREHAAQATRCAIVRLCPARMDRRTACEYALRRRSRLHGPRGAAGYHSASKGRLGADGHGGRRQDGLLRWRTRGG